MNRFVVKYSNDSKVPCGSRTVRRADTRHGYIGIEGFQNLAIRVQAVVVSWILEKPDLKNLAQDRSMFQASRLKTRFPAVKMHA